MKNRIALIPESFRPIESSLIRMGSERDGGYVVSQRAIESADHLLSFGLGIDWTFEQAFEDRMRAVPRFAGIDAYDPTLTRWRLIRSTWKCLRRKMTGRWFNRHATLWAYQRLFGKRHIAHHRNWIGDSDTPDTLDFTDVIGQLRAAQRAYVKMDIEGSEYEVLDQVARHHSQITGFSVEYHSFANARIEHAALFDKLHEHFWIVHVHVNNYGKIGPCGYADVIEVSYIHKSLARNPGFSFRVLPLAGLDCPNKPFAPDYRIRFVPEVPTEHRFAA